MKYVLGIDVTARRAAVALAKDDAVLVAKSAAVDGGAEHLLQLVADVLGEQEIELKDLWRIAVATGPGSFTGIRTGIATALGLREGSAVPVVGVSVFVANLIPQLETVSSGPKAAFIAKIDANREEDYVAAFSVMKSDDGFFVEELSSIAIVARAEVDAHIANKREEFGPDAQLIAITTTEDDCLAQAGLIARAAWLSWQTAESEYRPEADAQSAAVLPVQALYGRGPNAKTIAERNAKKGLN